MAGKWIDISSNRLPATKVAEQVLTLRVQHVQKMLPLAAWEYAEDVEHVHQLRVACRRAGAALQAFRPLMSEKPTLLRRWLRRIRQAAGAARDTDVLLGRIQHESQAKPFSEYVVARLQQQRVDVQQQLVAVEKRAKHGKIERSLKQCLATLGKENQKKKRTIGPFAKVALRKSSQSVMELTALMAPCGANEQPSLEQLHELRLAGKRLRYSIELFHSVFPTELRTEFYPLVEKLQSRLGKLNDHATAQAMFQRWLAQMPSDGHAAELARCIVTEHESAERLRAEFLDWWTLNRIVRLESYLGSF
ncbi:MAG: CHAD domain-containing protein [Planctomycetes bacterium]|nr:CHAD domain-containing protein [Planctomycetota bacterium]